MAQTDSLTIFTPSLKEIFAIALRLPAAPQIVAELSELLQDINTDLDQIPPCSAATARWQPAF